MRQEYIGEKKSEGQRYEWKVGAGNYARCCWWQGADQAPDSINACINS